MGESLTAYLLAPAMDENIIGYIAHTEELAFDGDTLSEEGAPAAAVGASEGDASFNKNGALFEDGTRTAAGRYRDRKMLEQVYV